MEDPAGVTGLDWDRAKRAKQKRNSRRALEMDASRDLPGTRKAMFGSTCPECHQKYPTGTRIVPDGDQWLHEQCRYDRANRQQREREGRTHPR